MHSLVWFVLQLRLTQMNKSEHKTASWCRPTHERAAKALAEDQPNPVVMDSVETGREYACKTQRGIAPTIGAAPAAYFDDKKSSNEKNPDSLVIGIGNIIPRWDNTPAIQLLYFVRNDTFRSSSDAHDAATAFQQAAEEWNKLNIGVTITSTNDRAQANFFLVWKPDDPEEEGVLAEAFFPNDRDQDVIVYAFALDVPDNRKILKNIFMHELGHVLGLRHEFAIKRDGDGYGPEQEPAVQFERKNPLSVMSYKFPPRLQDTDKEDIKKFYGLPNGTKIGRKPVTDYMPQIRSTT